MSSELSLYPQTDLHASSTTCRGPDPLALRLPSVPKFLSPLLPPKLRRFRALGLGFESSHSALASVGTPQRLSISFSKDRGVSEGDFIVFLLSFRFRSSLRTVDAFMCQPPRAITMQPVRKSLMQVSLPGQSCRESMLCDLA